MAQVVPNRTEIEGTVLSRVPHPTLADHDLLEVRVDSASPVPGFADLLAPAPAVVLELAVRRDAAVGAAPGSRLRGHASLRGPGAAFVQPLPDATQLVD